jgi:hypothetical protein
MEDHMHAFTACFIAARRVSAVISRATATILVATLTPLVEKNPTKLTSSAAPLVFSMTRLIVLAFAIGLLHQIWFAGVVAWPEATLAIARVHALPHHGARERAPPPHLQDRANALLGRFGVGSARDVVSAFDTRPSKYDDHRRDDQ